MPKTESLQPDKKVSSGEVRRGTIEEETRLTMEHVGKILEAAGNAA